MDKHYLGYYVYNYSAYRKNYFLEIGGEIKGEKCVTRHWYKLDKLKIFIL